MASMSPSRHLPRLDWPTVCNARQATHTHRRDAICISRRNRVKLILTCVHNILTDFVCSAQRSVTTTAHESPVFSLAAHRKGPGSSSSEVLSRRMDFNGSSPKKDELLRKFSQKGWTSTEVLPKSMDFYRSSPKKDELLQKFSQKGWTSAEPLMTPGLSPALQTLHSKNLPLLHVIRYMFRVWRLNGRRALIQLFFKMNLSTTTVY